MWKTTLDGWKPINDGMFAIYQLVQDFATICSNMDLFRYFVGCIPPRIWDLNHLDPPENWGSNSVRGYCRMGTMSLGFGPEVSDKTIWTYLDKQWVGEEASLFWWIDFSQVVNEIRSLQEGGSLRFLHFDRGWSWISLSDHTNTSTMGARNE